MSQLLVLGLVVTALSFGGCPARDAHGEANMTQRYFKSFSGHGAPLRPEQEITEAEARQRSAYVVAKYDPSDRLIRFEKFLHGKLLMIEEYDYSADGRLRQLRQFDGQGLVRTIDYP